MGYSPYITLLSVLFILTAFTLVQAFIVDQLADMLLASLFIFSTHARDRFEQVLYSRPCARYPLDTCCCCSVAQSCQTLTPWTAAQQASLSFTISQSLLKLMSIESVMTSNHLILCHPLPPSIFPSIKVFSSESVHHIRWPKYWNFSFSISLCKEYSGLISFRIDWLDLLAVQGTLKSLLQHHNSKTSLL